VDNSEKSFLSSWRSRSATLDETLSMWLTRVSSSANLPSNSLWFCPSWFGPLSSQRVACRAMSFCSSNVSDAAPEVPGRCLEAQFVGLQRHSEIRFAGFRCCPELDSQVFRCCPNLGSQVFMLPRNRLAGLRTPLAGLFHAASKVASKSLSANCYRGTRTITIAI